MEEPNETYRIRLNKSLTEHLNSTFLMLPPGEPGQILSGRSGEVKWEWPMCDIVTRTSNISDDVSLTLDQANFANQDWD